jgi:Cytochrome P450
MATNADEYNGYYIPKGTFLLGNAWSIRMITSILRPDFFHRSILHDPKVFNNPMEFQPERYLKDGKLNPDAMDPDCAVFGFGRRSAVNPICSLAYMLMDSSLPQYMSRKTSK